MSPASYQTAPPRAVSLCRAGNGTRTRDPNLGKVVLYQLSYSRAACNFSGRGPEKQQLKIADCRLAIVNCFSPRPTRRRCHGGEGDRTPDLVNAIHALSQLSYAPGKPLPALGSGQSGKLVLA